MYTLNQAKLIKDFEMLKMMIMMMMTMMRMMRMMTGMEKIEEKMKVLRSKMLMYLRKML